MPIAFACACGKKFQVPEAQAGKKAKCPACTASLVVPAAVDDFDVVDDEPAVAAKPAKASKVVVVEDDDDDRPKKKKKKKKSGGISKADWKAEEEERMYAAYKFKRLLYMGAGAGTIMICAIAFGIFFANGMLGLLPVGVCIAGFLGGLYCMWQGFSGSFHHD